MLSDSPSPKIERTCPRCGLVFFSDKIDAMCPACLISNTLEGEDIDDGPAFWEEPPVKKVAPARTFSHFELLDELGRGGMGVVYRARDLNTERIVALKVLQAHHLDVPDLVLRFRSEVRAVSSLDHSYVLPIHEVGEYEGIPFFSMKLTTGGSLAQSLGNYRNKPREAAQLLAKVSRGVQHAHERGILHRDLKPGNILLDAAGEPYVCDFGLAKWIEDDQKLTVTAAVLGTPHYIAPEQALGSKALTTAVDIYSLGAILYELLTGRPPFLGATVLETLVASQEKIPDRPSSIAKNVPADLETICLKALEHSPGSRYATAGAFADDLENWLAGRPINARPVNAAEQLWRWAKRNPLPALLVAALIATLVTIAVGATMAAVSIDRQRSRAVNAEVEALAAAADAREKLFQSLVAQARASRRTGRSGQRFEALDAISQAARIKKNLELRIEAIAALSLPDIQILRKFQIREDSTDHPMCFNRNLDTYYVADSQGAIELHNTSDQRLVKTLSGNGTSALTLTHSGKKYLTVRYKDNTVVLWNLAASSKILSIENLPSYASRPWMSLDCTFDFDEIKMATCTDDGAVSIYDIQTGTQFWRSSDRPEPVALAFSPSGQQLAAVPAGSALVRIYRVTPGGGTTDLPLPSKARSLAWSHNGRFIAVGAQDFNIYVFDLQNANSVFKLEGHRQDVTQVLFDYSDLIVFSTSRDKTIRLWDIRSRSELVMLPGWGVEPRLTLSPDNQRLGATDFNTDAVILEVESSKRSCIAAASPQPNDWATLIASIDYSSDGSIVATATYRGIDFWNAADATLINSIPIDPSSEKSISFSNDSKYLYVSSRSSYPSKYYVSKKNGILEIKEPTTVFNESGFILGTNHFSTEEFMCITSTQNKKAIVLGTPARPSITLSGQANIWDMVGAPEFGWVATSYSGNGENRTNIWSLNQGKLLRQLNTGEAGLLFLNPNHSRLISTGSAGAKIWDTSSWESLGDIPNAQDSKKVYTAAFSPDGVFIAISLGDRVFLLDATTYECHAILETRLAASQNYRLRFSPDGNFLAAQGDDNSLRIWNLVQISSGLKELGLGQL